MPLFFGLICLLRFSKLQLKTKKHSMLEWSVIARAGLEPAASGL